MSPFPCLDMNVVLLTRGIYKYLNLYKYKWAPGLATLIVLIIHFAIRQDEGSLVLQSFLQGLYITVGCVEPANANEIRSRFKIG
jgi:hypothetical protein